ncbi:hypothetical protein B0H12DRAFT_1082038 [Mycena haematopus]|nr:hypothetical protein B0H12DRAFT_1082038 [Mycena haematopus]
MHKTSSTTLSKSDKSSKPTLSSDGEQEQHFLSVTAKPVTLPVMSVDEFCRQYNLSENIREHLTKEEFQTAGSLLEVSESTLQAAGFKSGQIADLKKALKEFLISNITPGAVKDMS